MKPPLLLILLAASAWALPPLQFAELSGLQLQNGQSVSSCKLAFRTYGTLNVSKSNAVLFPTWFTGRSEQLDAFIAPDKLLDPARFFIITVDAPGNGVSCSPSNAGASLDHLAIADMVEAERRLVTERLGIEKLHAVIGISMGGMQTFEWITAHPAMVRNAIPIVGSPKLTSADLLLWNAELMAIEAVRKAGADPRAAMPAVRAFHEFALTTPQWLAENLPAEQVPALLAQMEKDSAAGMDPRDYAAQLRAMIGHDIARRFSGAMERAGAAVQARVLVVAAIQDHMVNPKPALDLAARAGFQVLRLAGNCGHRAPGCEEGRMAAAIRSFLPPPPSAQR